MLRSFSVQSGPDAERDTITYRGFNRDFSGPRLEHVVLVMVDGELDVYAIDDPRNVSGLLAYLSEHEQGKTEVLGCYSRRG